MNTSFLIGPYENRENIDIWQKVDGTWTSDANIDIANVPNTDDWQLRATFDKIKQVDNQAAKACERKITKNKATFPFHIDPLSIFSTLTNTPNNWLRANDYAWGYKQSEIYRAKVPNDVNNDENGSVNGMMSIQQIERYLKEYYPRGEGEDFPYLEHSHLVRYRHVMQPRLHLRVQELLNVHDMPSLYYHLVCYYGPAKFKEELNRVRNFSFKNRRGNRESKMIAYCTGIWTNARNQDDIVIQPNSHNNSNSSTTTTTTTTPTETLTKADLIRMMAFYLVRTTPQLRVSRKFEDIRMEKSTALLGKKSGKRKRESEKE